MKEEFDWNLFWIIVLGGMLGISFISAVTFSIIDPAGFKKETQGEIYYPIFIYNG